MGLIHQIEEKVMQHDAKKHHQNGPASQQQGAYSGNGGFGGALQQNYGGLGGEGGFGGPSGFGWALSTA
ncbi:uncharacterized protein RHOBADRAFT_47536 [Rhodotorula graminis WP1]|uniref:Uncharacterized protein n=1 Tax=Rhodotorula graminis (strain WP1) TaxID=578459 RepID=A0A0P9EXF0_RHOGW|nr:uncharacterized protein RHOBADRAFT_47536 [Rhodotorula graminis WP1]KPV71832.1 hypothetical protein RHOBADRAFT_47536 [Rhodotorula graminis WP1]